jgi:urease gamma subunit
MTDATAGPDHLERIERLEAAVALLCDALLEAVRDGRPEAEDARTAVHRARQLVKRG